MAVLNGLPEPLADLLHKDCTVSFIDFHWTDFCGIFNSRVVTKQHALKLARSNLPLDVGPGAMVGVAGLSSLAHSLSPGGSCSLYPDWSSLRVISPNHASVICSVSEEKTFHPGLDLKNPFLRCPRDLLKSLVISTAQNEAVSFLVGFELEFYLLTEAQYQNNQPFPEACCKHWNTASSMRGSLARCVEDCAVALQAAGIEVEQIHAESGAQQFEIVTGPLPVLSAIDVLAQSKEIVKIVSQRHALRATFLPTLPKNPGLGTSGLHVHLSIHRHGSGLSQKLDAAELEEAFLAGILHLLPGLCAFGMPNDNSFSRMQSAAVGDWVSWGTGNRFTPVRAVTENHWEFRAVDATANMYLTVAAYIAAGLLGVQEQQSLEIRDCRRFLQILDTSERETLGIKTRMPTRVEEARDHLQESDGLKQLLGEDLLSFYFDVKDQESQYLSKLSEDNRATVYLKNY